MAGFERMKAARLFAAELKSAAIAVPKKGSDQYESQLYLTPTGLKASRVMLVGTATEIEDIGNDSSFYRMRASDPTGVFFATAGQYQSESSRIMQELLDKLPAFVAVIGKMSVYTAQEGNILVSVRAERVAVVDENTRDMWLMETAKATLDRLEALKTNYALEQEVINAYPKRDDYKQIVKTALLSLKGTAAPATTPATVPTTSPTTTPATPPAQPEKNPETSAPAAKPSGKGSMSEEEMKSFVENLIIKKSKDSKGTARGVKIESLGNPCKGAGMTLIQLEKVIGELMNEGKIYEPKNGVLMPTEV